MFTMSFLPSLLVGLILVGLVYALLLSYYLKTTPRQRGWAKVLILCGLVYGGSDFSVLRGVIDATTGRKRTWIPTNLAGARSLDSVVFGEAGFGLSLLLVPTLQFPELLYLPCWYLFAGKFLFGPALSRLYQDTP